MQLGKLHGFQTYQLDSCKTEQIGRQLRQAVRPQLQNEKCSFASPSKYHAMILSHDANRHRMEFSETTMSPLRGLF
jgi:hypothetical protein